MSSYGHQTFSRSMSSTSRLASTPLFSARPVKKTSQWFQPAILASLSPAAQASSRRVLPLGAPYRASSASRIGKHGNIASQPAPLPDALPCSRNSITALPQRGQIHDIVHSTPIPSRSSICPAVFFPACQVTVVDTGITAHHRKYNPPRAANCISISPSPLPHSMTFPMSACASCAPENNLGGNGMLWRTMKNVVGLNGESHQLLLVLPPS
ncbi:hypothetical protein J3F83DRAFT_378521 [Trichoderma novae-zelandiae]